MTVIHSGMKVEDALTCDDAMTRAMARCTLSGWLEPFSAWVNAELDRPEGDPVAILHAVSRVFIQTIGSIAAQTISSDGDAILRQAFVALVERELLDHMRRTREEAAT